MRRTPILIGTCLALAAIAAGWRATTHSADASVTTAVVQRVPAVQSLVTASGEIVAARYADIGANVMGRLVALTVKEGDRVTAGQVLARIDPVQAGATVDAAQAAVAALEAEARAASTGERAAQAALEEAQSRATEAAKALTRATQLRDAGLMPAAEFDRAEAAADAAAAQAASAAAAVDRSRQSAVAADGRVSQGRAERVRARDQLQKTEITAPIDGVVTRLDVEIGEMVVIGVQNQPGTILMTISDLSTINAEVKVAEADVMRLSVGQPASIALEALPGRRLPGRVTAIGSSALPQIGAQAAAREFRVTVRLESADVSLRPGLTCDAEIVAAEKRQVLVVPLQAVLERDGHRGVFVLDGYTARFTAVSTGIIGGLAIEIDGVPEGAEIATGPIQTLRDLTDGASIQRSVPGQ